MARASEKEGLFFIYKANKYTQFFSACRTLGNFITIDVVEHIGTKWSHIRFDLQAADNDAYNIHTKASEREIEQFVFVFVTFILMLFLKHTLLSIRFLLSIQSSRFLLSVFVSITLFCASIRYTYESALDMFLF